ncbi:MAG: alpha/beta hydrolase family protein [Bacillota bacterium]
MRIIIKENYTNNIPVLSISPEKEKLKPLVIYIHGYGATKEQGIDFGYKMAKLGFVFISFDCMEHGEREKIKTQSKYKKFEPVYPPDTGIDTYVHMHEVIVQTQKDINIIIDKLQSHPQIDTSRIGLTGFSMGGFATFYNAAYCDYIKAAAPIAGKPAFKKAWDDIILSTSTYKQWSAKIKNLKYETESRTAFIKKIDPYQDIFAFAPKPLLIINGDQDIDQPHIYSLKLYKELLPYYQVDPEKLRLSMPFTGHCLTDDIKKEICDWFNKYL